MAPNWRANKTLVNGIGKGNCDTHFLLCCFRKLHPFEAHTSIVVKWSIAICHLVPSRIGDTPEYVNSFCNLDTDQHHKDTTWLESWHRFERKFVIMQRHICQGEIHVATRRTRESFGINHCCKLLIAFIETNRCDCWPLCNPLRPFTELKLIDWTDFMVLIGKLLSFMCFGCDL